jgi:hypothetical protein
MTPAILKFPSLHESVMADVLECLRTIKHFTSIDAVAGADTARLAAFVHYLTLSFGWSIVSQEKAIPCRDSHGVWVLNYHLPAEVVTRARAAVDAAWCDSVKIARAVQRSGTNDAARRTHHADSRSEQGSPE